MIENDARTVAFEGRGAEYGRRRKAAFDPEKHVPFDSHLIPVYHLGVEMHQLFINPASARNMAMCCCMCMCTGERPVLSNFS